MNKETYNRSIVFFILTLFIGTSLIPLIGSVQNERNNDLELVIENVDESTIEIKVVFPEFEFSSVSAGEGNFAVLKLQDEGYSIVEGKAKLPKLRRMVEIPQCSNPTITIKSVSWEHSSLDELDMPSKIIPVQPPTSKTQIYPEDLIIDDNYYNINGFIPDEIAKILETKEIRGRRFALVEISPVLYNPYSGNLKLMISCEMTIDLPGSNMARTYGKIERYSSPAFEDLYNVAFMNYGFYENMASCSGDSEGYLIIVYDGFYDEIMPLADWKDTVGYETTVTKTSEIPGGTTADNIKAYIEDAYNNWPTPPSYVLLVGDTPQIPTFVGTACGTETDSYFGTMDGDIFPDIYIGRFPASSETHVESMVDKTVYYEQGDFPSNDWIKKGAFIASSDHGQLAENTHNYVIDTHLEPNGYTCDKIYEANGGDTDDISNALNEGRSLCIYSGHGSPSGWGCVPFYQSNVNSLTNDGMYPFVCSHACSTAPFGNSECFGETWLRAPNKGGLAFWGSSCSTYWDEDDVIERRVFDAWWDDGLERIGQMTDRGMYDAYQQNPGLSIEKFMESYNVLGDPSIKIWREDPLSAGFSYSPSYPNTGDTIQFTDDSHGNIVSRVWDFDDGDSSTGTNPTHIYQSEGTFDVTLTVYASGGKSDAITIPVTVWDNWPPVPIAYPEEYAGNNPTVNFDGSDSWDPDGDNIVSYLWDFDDGETSNLISPSHTYSGDGIYDVTLTVTDEGGRSSVAHCDIKIDSYTPPVTVVTIGGMYGNDNWLRTPAQISFDATDWSGVDYTKYSINGGSWHTFSNTVTIYTNGYHTVSFYSVDIYGNIEDTKYADFKIDSEKPTLDVEIEGDQSGEWYVSPVTVTCSASDDVSGLYATMWCLLDVFSDDWNVYDGPFTIDEDGEYILRIYSEDMAGNTRGKDQPYPLKIDMNPPTTFCNLIGEGFNGNYYQEVIVELSAEDPGSGVDTTYYRLNGGEWMEYNDSFTVSSIGPHTLEFYSVDLLGNEEPVDSVDFTISNINFNLAITNPESGLYLFGNKFLYIQKTIIIGKITVEVSLTPYGETDPAVEYVEFLIDGESKAIVDTAPYEWTWDETAFGKHTITVIAYNEGESVEDSIEVTALIL